MGHSFGSVGIELPFRCCSLVTGETGLGIVLTISCNLAYRAQAKGMSGIDNEDRK